MVPMAFDALFTVREAMQPWLAPPEPGDWRSWPTKRIKREIKMLRRLVLCELMVASHGLMVEIDPLTRLTSAAFRWCDEFKEMLWDVNLAIPVWGEGKRNDSREIRFWHVQLLDTALQLNLPPPLPWSIRFWNGFPYTSTPM